ncbi:phage DNA-binding protein,Helix-turn-helix [[Clostridium] sordellii]|uniref:helix-turn-helix domain-containing protein n=1 Tax=Paraclostridium sordellii TaxID=1505 RepID=UPI000541B949|nr:helix-turn-helix transcriptional regulator [Paeniclostridium sordellii]CEK34614.1 phage DNA-binding protein,Helix-turn-helix [[Clostridium] sordellii] [Paeniclostridium sordellii]
MNIGENIKKIRDLKNISQDKLSKLSNMPRTSLGRYERGERIPNIDILKKIATGLNTDLDIVLHWTKILESDPDVIVFLERIFNNEEIFYKKLSSLVGLNPNSIEFLSFLIGTSNNKSPYTKIAEILSLTDNQLYNWILYNILINTFGTDDFKIPNVDHNTTMSIMKKLEKQTTDDLLQNGLSGKNEKIIKDYFKNRDSDILEKLKAKYLGENKSTKSLESTDDIDCIHVDLEIIDNSILQDNLKSKSTKINNLQKIFKSYDLDFSIFEENGKYLVNIKIDKDDFDQDFDLDDFLDFIDKIYWGIEREIDYLKHLYD